MTLSFAVPVQLQTLPSPYPARGFSLSGLGGDHHTLTDYRGQVVVLNFWSTWCTPCRKEMPALERAARRLRDHGVVVLSVAMQDDPGAIDNFLQRVPISFPVLLDPDGAVAGEWRVTGIPVTFIIDPEGQVVYRVSGTREWDQNLLIDQILALVEGTESPRD